MFLTSYRTCNAPLVKGVAAWHAIHGHSRSCRHDECGLYCSTLDWCGQKKFNLQHIIFLRYISITIESQKVKNYSLRAGGALFFNYYNLKEDRLMSIIFQSLGRTVIAGIVILALLLFFAGNGLTNGVAHTIGLRWLHVGCGVMWIGLLWYFNFVQIPSMPKIPDEQKPAISKVIAPAALFWFRWSALATVVTGLLVAMNANYLVQALT
jgi:hypothetical protein